MSTVTEALSAALWRNESASPSVRAADLVARMTLDEKAAQVNTRQVGADRALMALPTVETISRHVLEGVS